jgi:dihydroorotate dehydrogenase electron transfer subunit
MLDRNVKVKKVRDLGGDNYLLTLISPDQARLVQPGQFLMMKCCEDVDDPPLLRRPFSIFALRAPRKAAGLTEMEILVKDVGVGTHKLVHLQPGQEVRTLGPQGHAFHVPCADDPKVRHACIVAGGVGIAAVYLLAGKLESAGIRPVLFYGAQKAADLVLREDFERLGIQIFYATEDGSLGERGLVTAPLTRFLKQNARDGVHMYACGPWGMMRAVHILANKYQVPCQVSLEARMGCSLGACMGCVVQAGRDRYPEPHYIRVCLEGPVIDSRMIDWDAPPL